MISPQVIEVPGSTLKQLASTGRSLRTTWCTVKGAFR
jgi:hypothetical protein